MTKLGMCGEYSWETTVALTQAAHRHPLDIRRIFEKKNRISRKLFHGCPNDIQMSLLKISGHGYL